MSRTIKPLILLLILIAGFLFQRHLIQSDDPSWYLYATRVFLHGGKYYYDLFETSPPTIFYIYTPPSYYPNIYR